ncbi:MAG: peptide chain release factor 1 [Candidatus Marinimicrobia bacterium]|nr:peptide chain release factor 1 [Candidatus Neomarinimicrobiota bacterium]MCF7828843.1 peptide chain release factor 1 [Candidatus Neomarinimicrobiota bacterium]MCF7880760.1 peptide chain release factor 1 [Candidatus Neomarinimicrobiota bacterium]
MNSNNLAELLEKLEKVEDRYNEITHMLSDPDVIADTNKFRDLSKEHNELSEVVEAYKPLKEINDQIEEDEEILESDDDELKELVRDELDELKEQREKMAQDLRMMLVPKDPNDEKNTIVEIRAGTGGDEAALFASDLYRMYRRLAEKSGWKIEQLSSNPTGVGGYKEVVFAVAGEGVYGTMKFESGVHRVQRVPETESSGRIHTSAASVAVLPEAEEVDVDIDPNDLKIDVYRSTGPGGQSVNTTDSAVRITHEPTGLVVQCQDEKSQHKNKAKALKVLRSRLLAKKEEEQQQQRDAQRKSMVSTGDRSAKIRTYNFPQGRVTDHRINFTTHNLDSVLDGDLKEILEQLKVADRMEKLEAV